MRVLPCCAAGADVETFPFHLLTRTTEKTPQKTLETRPRRFPLPATFNNVAVDGGPELFAGLLVEVLAVDDPHLFEESRLAALAGAEQQDFDQPFHVGLLPREASVDLLGTPQLIHLAAVEQAYGQANF